MNSLPTFEKMRQTAYRLLGDASNELRSDWHPQFGPSDKQYAGLHEAMRHIAAARQALNTH